MSSPADQLKHAAEVIKKGGIVAFPTETVYGLGANIFDSQAIAKIFHAKGRPADNPLIAHVCDLKQVEKIATEIPDMFYRLASHFFPGPLTLVLKKHPNVPLVASGGLETMGIRMPDHPIALELIRQVGEPLVAPSANLSGKPSSTTIEHVLADFDTAIDAAIDGGPSKYGLESTVVSLVIDPPVILRPGAVTKEEIEKVLGIPLGKPNTSDLSASPGTRYRHYAPHAPIRLFTERKEFERYLSGQEGRILVADGLESSHLYRFLRRADEEQFEEVVIFCTEAMKKEAGLIDRLERAAEYK